MVTRCRDHAWRRPVLLQCERAEKGAFRSGQSLEALRHAAGRACCMLLPNHQHRITLILNAGRSDDVTQRVAYASVLVSMCTGELNPCERQRPRQHWHDSMPSSHSMQTGNQDQTTQVGIKRHTVSLLQLDPGGCRDI